jgi:hypothetical protein
MNEEIVEVVDLVPGTVRPLPTCESNQLTARVFWEEFVCHHQPLLIKAAATDWPALQKWQDAEYLARHSGEHRVPVARTFNPLPANGYFARLAAQPLRQAITAISEAADDTVFSIPSFAVPAGWAEDVGSHPFLTPRHDRKPRVYPRRRLFVYRNAGTEWHYHPCDETLTTQLRGRKRVALFRLDLDNWGAYSAIIESNLHHTRCARQFFPRELGPTKYEAILEPGDTIYIPPFYWHGLDAADRDFGITFAHCFRSPLSRVASIEEPIVRRAIQRCARSRQFYRAPFLVGTLALSALARRWMGQQWRVAEPAMASVLSGPVC